MKNLFMPIEIDIKAKNTIEFTLGIFAALVTYMANAALFGTWAGIAYIMFQVFVGG